ncbi:hypothetical protein SO694_000402109 [Aureococcus anophagefferens]|uniref:Uncharacterized protein n=1 Tax=Aureococcus anophagefferens TaxID=44056 RepID=A0ABR1G6E3_AURAN
MTVAPPRLHVLWHVELHGEDAAINDLEKLEHETKQARATQPVQDARDLDQVTGALLWKVHGHRFGGGGKKNKRAFDEFCARVGDGVTKGDGGASGDAYAALRRDARSRARRSPGPGGRRPSPTTGPKRRRAPPPPEAPPPPKADDVGAAWLVGKCDALGSSLGRSTTLRGVLGARRVRAKKSDAEMQGALMELLGFGDAALTLMGELCEKKAAVAAVVDARVRRDRLGDGRRRRAAAPSLSFAAPPSTGAYRQGGSVRIGGEKKQSQRSKKQQRRARRGRARPAAADYLEALGFDERYLAQERSLGLQKNVVEERMSHAEDLLGGAEREYRETERSRAASTSATTRPDESPAERRKAFLADLAQHKAVYVAPLKALAQEVVDKFKERLAPLGMIVKELTGDAQLSKKEGGRPRASSSSRRRSGTS